MRLPFVAIALCFLVVSIAPVFAAQINFTYDANGNQVSGDGYYRTYNSLNQLWRVYNGTNSSAPLLQEYTYDPVEERVLVKDTYFSNGTISESVYYISQNKVIVVNSSGTYQTNYVYHAGQLVAQQDSTGAKLLIIGNTEGSATVVTNSSGAVIENSTYSPFGERIGSSTLRYGYEGKEQDNVLGDTDFNFRKYNSGTGLFEQPDTLLPNVYDPQQLNRYAFERNNPYNKVDPTGHFLWDLVDVGIVAWDAHNYNQDPSGANLFWLGLSVVSLLPGLPNIAGYFRYGDKIKDGVSIITKTSKVVDDTKDLTNVFNKVDKVVSANKAYETALAGGKHAKLITNYAERSGKEIAKGIKSYQKKIDLHKEKILNPQKEIENWKKWDTRKKQGQLSYWQKEVDLYTEQRDVLKGILDNK